MNSLKAIKQKNWKSWWRTVYGRLMNESIARSRTRGSPRWMEKTMMITCSSTPNISLHESLYHPQHPWVGILHQINAKNVLQRNWIKSVWRAISRLWGILERDSCMQIRRQLGGEPPVHNKSMVKISYNIKMTTQKIRSHDDRRSATWIWSSSPTILYCSDLHETFTVFQTEVQALYYPWWSPERRRWFSNTYLRRWADKQTFW